MRHLLASLVPVLLPSVLLSATAIAADGDRQSPDPSDAKGGAVSDSARPVPWLVPNLQIQSWLTVWDQDESAQADAGGYSGTIGKNNATHGVRVTLSVAW